MIRDYNFNYDFYKAEVYFIVDTRKLKVEDAKELLEFFVWYYDKEGDLIDQLMKKYALKVIEVAFSYNYNKKGVIDWFEEQEGFLAIDGSQGVELVSFDGFDLDEDYLDMEVITRDS